MRQFSDPLACLQVEETFFAGPCGELAVDKDDLIKLRIKFLRVKQVDPYFRHNCCPLLRQQEGHLFQ